MADGGPGSMARVGTSKGEEDFVLVGPKAVTGREELEALGQIRDALGVLGRSLRDRFVIERGDATDTALRQGQQTIMLIAQSMLFDIADEGPEGADVRKWVAKCLAALGDPQMAIHQADVVFHLWTILHYGPADSKPFARGMYGGGPPADGPAQPDAALDRVVAQALELVTKDPKRIYYAAAMVGAELGVFRTQPKANKKGSLKLDRNVGGAFKRSWRAYAHRYFEVAPSILR